MLIAPIAHPGHQAQKLFASQFFRGQCLDHVQELLGDQSFKFAKRLLFKNRSDLGSLAPFAFIEDQLSNFLEQRHGRRLYLFLEFLLSLDVRQDGEFAGRQLQNFSQLFVNVSPIRSRRHFFSGQ